VLMIVVMAARTLVSKYIAYRRKKV
jgi:hypothetical protein